MSARMRSASSSVTRGSICRSTDLPFTLSITRTGPGPTALAAPCASTPGAWASTPAATPPAPTVLRKVRRLKPGSSLRLGMKTSKSGSLPQVRALYLSDPRASLRSSFTIRVAPLVQREPAGPAERQRDERADQDQVELDAVAPPWRAVPVQEEPVVVVHFPRSDRHLDGERQRDPDGRGAQDEQDAAAELQRADEHSQGIGRVQPEAGEIGGRPRKPAAAPHPEQLLRPVGDEDGADRQTQDGQAVRSHGPRILHQFRCAVAARQEVGGWVLRWCVRSCEVVVLQRLSA